MSKDQMIKNLEYLNHHLRNNVGGIGYCMRQIELHLEAMMKAMKTFVSELDRIEEEGAKNEKSDGEGR